MGEPLEITKDTNFPNKYAGKIFPEENSEDVQEERRVDVRALSP